MGPACQWIIFLSSLLFLLLPLSFLHYVKSVQADYDEDDEDAVQVCCLSRGTRPANRGRGGAAPILGTASERDGEVESQACRGGRCGSSGVSAEEHAPAISRSLQPMGRGQWRW
jgi:hypothetical protein